jgi:hypothetical protein
MRLSPLWLALHAAVAIAPAVGLALHAPDMELFGVEAPAAVPKLTFGDWMKEDVQKGIKSWFESHLGFRGVLVRSDNTLFYTSLHETRPGATVKLGKGDTLFIDDDLWYASRRPQDLPAFGQFAHFASLLVEVQQLAESRGKHLVVILSPAKTSLYAEEIPAEWKRRRQADVPPDQRMYEAFRDALTHAGARFTDGRALLTAAAGERELLYAHPSRHWTQVGACRVFREAVRGAMTTPSCRYSMQPEAPGPYNDLDLYTIENRWRTSDPPLMPILAAEPRPANPPRILFVGSSFCWKLVDAARPLVRDLHVFYYNSTIYDGAVPPNEVGKVDPKGSDWAHYALEKDVYIVEILEAYAAGTIARDFLRTLRDRL